jgi:hypothetical protein
MLWSRAVTTTSFAGWNLEPVITRPMNETSALRKSPIGNSARISVVLRREVQFFGSALIGSVRRPDSQNLTE